MEIYLAEKKEEHMEDSLRLIERWQNLRLRDFCGIFQPNLVTFACRIHIQFNKIYKTRATLNTGAQFIYRYGLGWAPEKKVFSLISNLIRLRRILRTELMSLDRDENDSKTQMRSKTDSVW